MSFWSQPELPKMKVQRINVNLVRQAVKEIQEAMGQVVESMDPWEYPSIHSDEKSLMLSKHKLHEAAVNLIDAGEMLKRAAPEEL